MAVVRCIAAGIVMLAILTASLRGQDDLVPISPSEEQGRRSRVVQFAPPREAPNFNVQEEELPPPVFSESHPPIPTNQPAETGNDSQPVFGGAEAIRQRYPDGKVQILRYVRQDEQGNYFNDGPWKLYNRDGQILAEGEFAQGAMHGTWTRWHPVDAEGIFRTPALAGHQGPFLSVATFHQGKLDGVWTIYDRSRRKIFEMQYVGGLRDGTATWWNEEGDVTRQMHFRNGRVHGQATAFDSSGRPLQEITYVDGRREFAQTQWHREKQKKSETYYLDAKLDLGGEDRWWDARPAEYVRVGEPVRNGPTRAWYENGQPQMEGQYIDDQKQGLFVWWHSNGQKAIAGEFANDQRTGPWTWWHPNGLKAVQGTYEADVPVGPWQRWDETGKILSSAEESHSPPQIPVPLDEDLPILSPPEGESLEDISPNLGESIDFN